MANSWHSYLYADFFLPPSLVLIYALSDANNVTKAFPYGSKKKKKFAFENSIAI